MKIRDEILAAVAIIIGLLSSLIYLFNFFFIQYYSSIGIRESGSSFGFSLMLFVAGFIAFKNFSLGRALMFGYVIGCILERALVYILYKENVSIDIFLLPLVSSAIILVMLVFSRDNFPFSKRYNWIVGFLIVIITVIPKIIG